VTVSQLGVQLGSYLPLTGGTMTGSIYMSSSNISGIDTTTTRVLNTDVLNGKSANIIATNSVLDMGGQSIQNANTVTATNLQGNLYSNSLTSVNETSAINVNVGLAMGDGGNIDMGLNYRVVNLPTTLGGANDAISVSQAQALVTQTNNTISGTYSFAQAIRVNGILAQSSDITGVDNITATSFNVDSIQANAGGGIVFNSPVVLTNPQNGTLQSIQGANSITCKTVAADTQLSVGNIIMGTGGFNMFQQVISNLPDTTASQPTNAVNYQTMAGFHTTTNLTADGPLLMGTQPVISHNSPSVSGHLVNLHHFEHNSIHSNTYYINDNQTDIQAVYNAHSNEQGVTFKISSGSYGGSTLTINNSHNQLFECSHPGNGGTITELAGGRGLTILNSSRIRFTGLQVEGPLVINGNWPTVNTNHVFSCCEFLSGVTLGNLSAITGFITFYKCTFAGPAITYNTGTATVYFDQCDFGNTPIVNSGLPTRIVVSNAAGLNSLTQSNYVGYGILTNTAGTAYHSANALVTPLNATSIQSAQIEVGSNPSSANALTRKLYVDSALSGKLTSISAGDNITIDFTNPLIPVISSAGGGAGVTSVTAGTGINVTGTSTDPIVNNTGVLELTAGTAIEITGTKSNYTITNNGVRQINSGTGIQVGGTSTSPTIANTGVLELTAGTNITITGTKNNYTINATGGGGGGGGSGINNISAGEAITITGTSSSPIISQSRFKYITPTVNTGPVDTCLDFGYNWVCANPDTGTIIASGGQIASGTDQIVCIRSTDGGATWSIPLDPNNQQTWRDPESGNVCYDIRRAWCLGGIWFLQNRTTPLKSLLRSADDGLTWQKVSTPTTQIVNDIARMTGTDNYMAVTNTSGTNGNKWTSTNGGLSWGTSSQTIGGRTVIIRSVDYAVDPILGYGVFVITTSESTASRWKVAFCDTALNNFQPAFLNQDFTFGTSVSIKCCKWVPVKNKWFVFCESNIGGNDPANNTINVGSIGGVGQRVFWAPTVSNDPAAIALPFKNPTQRLIYTGSINIDWASVNSLGEIFVWCTNAQSTGYKCLYQRADQLGQFMPIEVLSSSEAGITDAVNHCFTYTGSRWVGCMGRETSRSGAWFIEAPQVLP
jgi:hypothetical protein